MRAAVVLALLLSVTQSVVANVNREAADFWRVLQAYLKLADAKSGADRVTKEELRTAIAETHLDHIDPSFIVIIAPPGRPSELSEPIALLLLPVDGGAYVGDSKGEVWWKDGETTKRMRTFLEREQLWVLLGWGFALSLVANAVLGWRLLKRRANQLVEATPVEPAENREP